jgi:nicotinamidase-related amidase
MSVVEIPEIPWTERVELPADRTAVLVVDMQNDFVHEKGALRVPAAAATVGPIRDLLSRARKAEVQVIFTQDWHSPDDEEFASGLPTASREPGERRSSPSFPRRPTRPG